MLKSDFYQISLCIMASPPYIKYAELQTYKHKVSHKKARKVLQRTLKRPRLLDMSSNNTQSPAVKPLMCDFNITTVTMNTCGLDFEYSRTCIVMSLFWMCNQN